MKYRIVTTTYKNGRKTYNAQVKHLFLWYSLNFDGKGFWFFEEELRSRAEALERIDSHFEGNTEKQTIEFEYINK